MLAHDAVAVGRVLCCCMRSTARCHSFGFVGYSGRCWPSLAVSVVCGVAGRVGRVRLCAVLLCRACCCRIDRARGWFSPTLRYRSRPRLVASGTAALSPSGAATCMCDVVSASPSAQPSLAPVRDAARAAVACTAVARACARCRSRCRRLRCRRLRRCARRCGAATCAQMRPHLCAVPIVCRTRHTSLRLIHVKGFERFSCRTEFAPHFFLC